MLGVFMRLIDTHCHLDFPDYKDDLADVVKSAEAGGVVRMIVPGTNIESSEKAVRLAAEHPAVFAAVGIHPHEADKADGSMISRLRELAVYNDKVIAVGEIGLDNYKKYSKPENQVKLFGKCLTMARELDLPVILHNRSAEKELLEIFERVDPYNVKGVMHCFSGSRDLLKAVLARGLYVSFTGTITFPNSKEAKELIREIPPERLLLETDAPYLTPVPFRGKRNEPAYVRYLLDVYADAYGMPAEDIADITTRNANELFRLGTEKEDTIVYEIRDSIYINATHRCTNRCSFCTRNISSFVKGYDLRLDKEPTSEETIKALGDVSKYKEVAFCGLGEPMLRLGMIKKVASHVKANGGSVRVITNGEGDLIAARPVVPEIKDLVDKVSVSVNASSAEQYDHICRPLYGERAYGAIIRFIKECRASGIEVEITCLDFVGEDTVSELRGLAEEVGATFRLRHLGAVG